MITGFGNNVVSALAADITASQTTIQVMPGAGEAFARLLTYDYQNTSNDLRVYAKITLTDAGETEFEVCHLTAVNNDMLTVVRGQEGTTAKGWTLNDVVANFATRGSENQFVQIEHLQSGHYTSGVARGTENALTLELPASYFVNGSTSWELRTPLVVYPSANNTGPATLQLIMGGRPLGTFRLYKGNRSELAANDILKDVAMVCVLDRTKEFFSVSNPGAIYAGLGTAAFRDVQESRDDVTPGRVLVNGGALALRTVAASGEGGAYTDDCNNLPANSVSFCYASAANSPGYEATILDVAGLGGGYRVQYAVSYADGGRRIKYRTFNADNGVWAEWQQIVIASGGDYPGSFRFARVGVIPTESNETSLFSEQAGSGGMVSGTEFNWYGSKVRFGILRNDSTGVLAIAVQLNGTTLFTISPDGTVTAGNALSANSNVTAGGDIQSERNISSDGFIQAGAGVYDTPGVRVYSPNNPPPQQDLSPYATQAWVAANFPQQDLSPYATQAWVAANFLQSGIRLSSLGRADNGNNDNLFAYAPDGAIVTAVQQKTNYTAVQYRYVQFNINGNWYTAWVA